MESHKVVLSPPNERRTWSSCKNLKATAVVPCRQELVRTA